MATTMPTGKPFTGADDPRRHTGGRASKLADPEFVELFATALAQGLPNAQLCEEFEVSEWTVKKWKKDPRVKSAAFKLIEDRILRITRKIDAEMENRLASLGNLSVKEILDIRKEYLGGVLRMQAEGGKVTPETINNTMEELEKDPELAAELRELLSRGSKE